MTKSENIMITIVYQTIFSLSCLYQQTELLKTALLITGIQIVPLKIVIHQIRKFFKSKFGPQ